MHIVKFKFKYLYCLIYIKCILSAGMQQRKDNGILGRITLGCNIIKSWSNKYIIYLPARCISCMHIFVKTITIRYIHLYIYIYCSTKICLTINHQTTCLCQSWNDTSFQDWHKQVVWWTGTDSKNTPLNFAYHYTMPRPRLLFPFSVFILALTEKPLQLEVTLK